MNVLLVRYSEVFLKGQNRGFFERRLRQKLSRAVAGISGARVEGVHGRYLVWPGVDGVAAVERAVSRVFGVASISNARVIPRSAGINPEAIYAVAVEEARAEVARLGLARPPRFKVESRRSDKRFQPTSPELSRLCGAEIVRALSLPVDVHKPEITINLEIGYDHAFVYSSQIAGPGGLPTGVSGRVELLLSGGIDSPVAGWLMQKRGCVVGATYFHSFPFTGEKTKDKVVALGRKLANWQLEPMALSVVGFTDTQKKLRDVTGDGRLAVVLYRRQMLRVASELAKAHYASALITGEALAQVASQTLENLTVIAQATTLPILRPCIGHDKIETIGLAERIGTFETSILPYDDCCSLFVPKHPATRAKLEDVLALESKLDIAALTADCLAKTETILCE